MKSILLSIRPNWTAKILNGEKTIEVRKQFPKDYVGWVYIYCTKDSKHDWYYDKQFGFYFKDIKDHNTAYEYGLGLTPYNGKVVARFWCDNVEEITTEKWSPSKEQDLLKASCLTENQLFDYCNLESGKPFYAIHISKLEIFDRPRELSEFNSWVVSEETHLLKKLTKAPQNYCYVEGE